MPIPDDDPRLERALEAFLAYHDAEPTPERAAFLNEHDDLRDLLEPMLDEGAGTVHAGVGAAGNGAGTADRLGDFELLSVIGRGGMGVVHEARQLSVDRPVALKVLTPGLGLGAASIARFQREATLAGRLSHPGIVEVFTVGSVGGTHYFAMELVDGVPVDQLLAAVRERVAGDPARLGELDEAALRTLVDDLARRRREARVGGDDRAPSSAAGGRAGTDGKSGAATGTSVFRRTWHETAVGIALQVAEALHHAHEGGVLHRDVKPSNVLLRRDGRIVLVDFGLARETGLPSMTLSGEFLGTPYYVAPEQAEGRRTAVGAAVDVYSVGAMLHELVTLAPPFPGATAAEVLHKVVHEEAADPRRRNRTLRPDLAAVVLRCLEKDPANRYASAGELADDLRALLELRPVRARRVSPVVRGARWAQRNRALAGTAFVASAVLFVGLIVTTIVFYGQNASLVQAREGANAVNDFLVQKLILASDPRRHRGKPPTVEQVLEVATREVATSFEGQPLLEATVRHTLGKAWAQLGKFDRAREQLDRCLDVRRAMLPPDARPRLESELELALLLKDISDHRAARDLARDVRERARAAFGPDDDVTLAAGMAIVATSLALDEDDEAEREVRDILERRMAVRGPDHERTLSTRHQLARILENQGRLEEAEATFREVLERRKAVLPADHPDLSSSASDLASVLVDRDRLEEAREHAEFAVESARHVYGEEHPAYVRSLNMLSTVRQYLGRAGKGDEHYEAAVQLMEESLRQRAALYGEDSLSYARGLNNIAVIYSDQGKWDKAQPYFERVLKLYEKELGEVHGDTVLALLNLAAALGRSEGPAAGLPCARRAVAAGAEAFGPEHHMYGHALGILGRLLRVAGETAEAIPVLEQSYTVHVASLGPTHSRARRVAHELRLAHESAGRADEAARWAARAADEK